LLLVNSVAVPTEGEGRNWKASLAAASFGVVFPTVIIWLVLVVPFPLRRRA